MNRRNFIKNSSVAGLSVTALSFAACNQPESKENKTKAETETTAADSFVLNEITIDVLQQKMQAGELSSHAITQLYLDRINQILDIYRIIYNKGMNTSQALNYIEEEFPATDERDEIVTFIRDSGRGIIKRFTKGSMDDE